MTLLTYQVFKTVTEQGSFRKAADLLGLTPSAVSHAVSSLEAELGFCVLNRAKSGVTLTNYGERLLPYVNAVLNSDESLQQAISEFNGLKQGKVKVGCFSSVCTNWIPELIHSFHEEYPDIDWDNLADENVQLATIIYNDRIVSWKQMKAISEKMDRNECTAADIFTMVRLRIRNLQAFKELQSYNDTGTFRYQHPLVEGKSERAELIKLLQQDPQEFLKKHRNCLDSIRRYESYLRNPERQNRKEKDRKLLQKYMLRDTLFKEIISNSHERKE